jgi:putative hydrolase
MSTQNNKFFIFFSNFFAFVFGFVWFWYIFLKFYVIFVVFYQKMVYNLIMKAKMDLHTHSIASGHHTLDTVTTLAKRAKELGLEYLGITDHAPKMQGAASVNYFRNLRYCDRAIHEVKILYGAELNVLSESGEIDLPADVLDGLDYTIASLHKQVFKPKSKEENTLALINAMKNRYVVAIGHPDDPTYEIDVNKLVDEAKNTGTILELSSVGISPDGYRDYNVETLINMLLLCKQKGVYIMLGSDSHGAGKIGDFKNAYKLLEEIDFPSNLVVNYTPEKFFEIVKTKRN